MRDELLSSSNLIEPNDTAHVITPEHEPDEEEKRTSQASALVAFVNNAATLFHDNNGQVYAKLHSTNEVYRLDSRRFRDWLLAMFYQETEKSARDQSIREAINTLTGLSRQNGECHEVNIRVGMHHGAYYVDLAEPGLSRAIELKPGSWRIVDTPPCYFIRPETIRPLPCPVPGHEINKLWDFVNIPDDSKLLVLAWLVDCFRPDTPFPILELFGEQGSAKSTTQTILRQLIDPNASDLRTAPKSPEDIFVCAGVNWLSSYENISHLSKTTQDALCTLSTGAGFAKRKLYSDADESVIQVKRPIVLNGICVSVTAQDLVDRTLSIETPVITDRVKCTDIMEEFENTRPQLLGSLFDIAAQALKISPSINLCSSQRPRLIEFVYLGMAISYLLNGDEQLFLIQFNAARSESIARAIESSPVSLTFIEWFEKHPYSIEITMSDLLKRLTEQKPSNTEKWPTTPRGMGTVLSENRNAFKQYGIECKSIGKKGSYCYWQIKPVEKF